MPSPRRTVLRRLGAAVALSLVLGLITAGLALPVVGAAGLTVQAQAEDFLELPTGLAAVAPPNRTRILDKDGRLLASLFVENRVSVSLSQVPEHTRQAVLAIEDSRFYEHNGVDVKGTARAAIANVRDGRVSQGGSTLTQQYVKNALLSIAVDEAGQKAAREDSLDRKLREARYAMALERRLSKDEILERYLNIAYYGRGVYGIGAAADYYFSLPVSRLSLAQSALLAGLVQNPSAFDPVRKEPARRAAVRARRNTVLARMAAVGYLSQREATAAAATPVTLKVHPLVSGCENPAIGVYAFFCDYVRRELELTDVGRALGDTLEERQRRLLSGGLVVRTTLDRKILLAAQKAVDEEIPRNDLSKIAAVANVVEPGTGLIKAMAVNRGFGADPAKRQIKLNLAIGGSSGYQGGSTFKPFVLAQALKDGLPLDTSLYAPATYSPKAFPYEESVGVPKVVGNAEVDEAGTFDLVSGTHASVNTYFIQIEERTGLQGPPALAESLGVRRVTPTGEKPLQRFSSFVFGTDGVSPLAMAGAYAAFGARGTFCPPRAVLSVSGPNGRPLDIPPPTCGQALDAPIADTVTSVLQGVVDGDDPLRTGRRASLGRPVAGKTGTTNNAQAAWFVGYTPQLATAVWVGGITPKPMQEVTVNGQLYKRVYGGTIPATIFRKTMVPAHEGLPVKQFPLPLARASGKAAAPQPAAIDPLTGEPIPVGSTVPYVRGQSRSSAEAALRAAGLVPVRARRVDSSAPEGSVAYTSPRAGRSVSPGGTVYLYTSRGQTSSDSTQQDSPARTTASDSGTSDSGPSGSSSSGSDSSGSNSSGSNSSGSGGSRSGGQPSADASPASVSSGGRPATSAPRRSRPTAEATSPSRASTAPAPSSRPSRSAG